VRRVWFGALLFASTFVVLAFLALPVIAIFTHVSPVTLIHQFSNPVVVHALEVSAKTTVVAQLLIFGLGTPAAWFLASHRFRGRSVLITVVELPLVLPPAVAGIGLLVAFGRMGLLRTSIPFTQAAVVLAVAFVAGPLYVRAAIAAFEGIDPRLIDASRTLGASPQKTFARVALPLARAGLGAGAALSVARGLGEFGATIMFAGSREGVTQTLPLAIYDEFAVDFDVTLAISALLVLLSAAVLVSLKLASSWTFSLSRSTSRSEPSLST
jgi:molybdate transport system permease protein